MSDPVLESFDSYASVTGAGVGVVSKWLIIRDSADVALVAGRYSGQALSLEADGNLSCPCMQWPLGFNTNTFACHFNFRMGVTSLDTKSTQVGFCNDNNAEQFGLKFMQDGRIEIATNSNYGNDRPASSSGTTVYTSTNALFQPGIWNNCSLIAFVHDSTGYVGVKINGELVFLASGIDTKGQSANDHVNAVRLGSNSNNDGNTQSNFAVDDLYVVPDSSAYIAEGRSERIFPNSDGSHLGLTPSTGTDHYAVVDGPADSTDYLQGSNVGDYDYLGLSDLTSIPAEIFAVFVVGYATKTDSGSRAIGLGIESGGTDDAGPDYYLSTNLAKYERGIFLDPDTSAQWTLSGVNALQLRPTVTV